jgi:hypothetical protein
MARQKNKIIIQSNLDCFGVPTSAGDWVHFVGVGGIMRQGKVVRCTPSGFTIETKVDSVTNRVMNKVARVGLPPTGAAVDNQVLVRALDFYASRSTRVNNVYMRYNPATMVHEDDNGTTAREALKYYGQQ